MGGRTLRSIRARLEGATMAESSARGRRMNQIFRNDGRSVIVAMDGAPVFGPISGMADPRAVLVEIVQGGADAVLMTYGLAQRYGEVVSEIGMILRCDGAVSTTDINDAWRRVYGTDDALRLGADAVCVNAFPQCEAEQRSLEYLAALISEAAPWNVPVLAESLPGGFPAGPEQRTAEAIAFAVRAASELGADFVKTAYTGSPSSFASVVESSYVPVVVLGGAAGPPRNVLQVVADAMRAGASGVAIGRNVWMHPHPRLMTRAIAAIVHESDSVDAALEILQDEPVPA